MCVNWEETLLMSLASGVSLEEQSQGTTPRLTEDLHVVYACHGQDVPGQPCALAAT